MITARQAREMVEQSSIVMERRLEQISEKIIEASMLGKSELWLPDALPYHKEFEVVEISYRNPEFTPLQHLIKTEMERLGYSFKIVDREVTIGGGLGSMDDAPREEKRPYIRVTW